MTSHRLLIVSDRLPVSARMTANSVRIVPSSGGLARGLRPWHGRSQGLWLGWPARRDHTLRSRAHPVAWHYRGAPRDFGARQAHELRMLLGDLLSNQPLEVLEGEKVIEVRLRGVSKGVVAQRVGAETGPGTVIVAIGDDRTDEELFRALPPSSLTVAVGRPWTSAKFRLDDHRAVRRVLRELMAEAGSSIDSRLNGGQLQDRVPA